MAHTIYMPSLKEFRLIDKMKILIVSQIVDSKDPILGFFHRWIEEFSQQFESVHVICLKEGEHSLPSNVHVHSLGKENGQSRIKYLYRFYKYVLALRKEYDVVFVHMNPEYVVLGGALWHVLRKKVGMWYAHGTRTTMLRVATFFSDIAFTSTSAGFPLSSKKVCIVGQGIDTISFAPSVAREDSVGTTRLITVSRLSRSKNILTLLEAVSELKGRNLHTPLTIVGVPITSDDHLYKKELDAYIEKQSLRERVTFSGGIPNSDLPKTLATHNLLINAYGNHSMDKALLEAMACGVVPISSNTSYTHLVKSEPELEQHETLLVFSQGDRAHLVESICSFTELPDQDKKSLALKVRATVVRKYPLEGMVRNILNAYAGFE